MDKTTVILLVCLYFVFAASVMFANIWGGE